MIESLLLALSWPLRMMATVLAVWVVHFFDPTVTSELTTVTVGAAHYAITDACSGIEQLGGMLVVGAAIAWWQQRSWGRALFQYAFIVPAVVVANAARIIATVVGYRMMGEAIFADLPHVLLGWAQTAAALGLFALVGMLLGRLYGAESPAASPQEAR